MINDGFQYFLDNFWNFQNVHQIWTFPLLLLCRNATQYTRQITETSLKHLFISHHFGNPTFPKIVTLPGIEHLKPIFSFVLQNMVDQKRLAYHMVSLKKIITNCGFLDILGNQKKHNPEVCSINKLY